MFRLGVHAVDITPPLGTHLSGSGMGDKRPAARVLDRLYAKAVVMEEDGRRFCLLVMDNTIVAQEWTDALHAQALAQFGLHPHQVMVQATQTHSAPALGRFMLDIDFPLHAPAEREYLWGSEKAYTSFALEQAVQAIHGALLKLEPVDMGFGSAWRNDLAYNRREEKHIDPQVLVVGFQNAQKTLTCVLLHYTCHPVNVFLRGAKTIDAKRQPEWFDVSADWPGIWCQALQPRLGPQCVPVVINGCCGNINPEPYRPDSKWDHLAQGQALAHTAGQILDHMTFQPVSGLSYGHTRVALDYRQVPPERLAVVKEHMAQHPTGLWRPDGQVEPEWFYSASTHSIALLAKREPTFQYEVYTLKAGPLALVGLPGEPFTEGQVAIKEASPAQATLLAHMVSHYVGYLPTRQAYQAFGHEANERYTYWAKLAPGSLERVVDTANAQLASLYAPQ